MNFIDIAGVALEVRHIEPMGLSTHLAPIVFLHEGLGSVGLWTQRGIDWPEAVCKATGRAGLVYSRAGYGQSAPSPAVRPNAAIGRRQGRPEGRLAPDYMHREACEVLPALLARLGISEPVLVGHSDGASIALLYASRFPVSACIAMAPHVVVEPVAIAAITAAKDAFDTGLRERLAKYHTDVEGAFWQWNDVWLSDGFSTFDIRGDCARIKAPLLLIQGLDDEYGTMLQLDAVALAAPHARQLRLAACGHSPPRDQPVKTVDAIASFLETVA